MRPADYLRLTLLAAIWGASFLYAGGLPAVRRG